MSTPPGFLVSFGHSPAIWQEFPQLVPGVLVVENIRPEVEADGIAAPWIERARERLRGAAESELPEVAAWRRAYARMGLKPTQYRSAAEALLRRVRREGTLPRLHPLVDLCNAVSIAFALPIAVLDVAENDRYYVFAEKLARELGCSLRCFADPAAAIRWLSK